jgi:hypothetical protein
MSGSFPHVRVQGGARARGTAYGEEARERVRRSVDAYREVFLAEAGWDWPRVTQYALGYTDAIERFEPRYLEEIAGIATGAGLATEDIVAINVRMRRAGRGSARRSPSRPSGARTATPCSGRTGTGCRTPRRRSWCSRPSRMTGPTS